MKCIVGGAFLLAFGCCLTFAQVATHDLSRDFSLAGNPNGVWSYGRQETIGGVFTLLESATSAYAENGVPIEIWALPYSQLAILHNDATETAITDDGEGSFPPETTWFAPGEQGQPGNYAVARFTLPVGGDEMYQLVTTARPSYGAAIQSHSDFHVVRNNVEIFGAHLNGAQTASYTNVLALAAGDTIDFVVGRGADNSHFWSALKVEATLARISSNGVPPIILSHPTNQVVLKGGTATFSVSLIGSAPLSYQWRRDGTAIPDATDSTLVLTNVQVSQAGDYSLVVSNALGVATSQTATLTVSASAVLVVPNMSRTIDDGGGSTLLSEPSRHQIVYDDTLFPVEIMRITELRMRPSAAHGSAFTATISNLQINLSTTGVEPNQLNGTFAQNVGVDEVVVFQGALTVSSGFIGPAAGPKEFDIIIPLSTPFLYDSSRGNLLIDFRNASGSSASFVDMGQRSDDGASRLFATSVGATSYEGADFGAEAFQILYMPQRELPPIIYVQPYSRSTFVGETVTFTVETSGSRPLKYQWYRGAAAIPEATNATLVLSNMQLSQAGNYFVVVSNAFGVVTSQTATLTVSESPVRVVPKVSRTIDDGGGSTLLLAPARHQIVYDDALFPVEIMRITELRMRPSAALGSAFTATISNLQINLSTTSVEPNGLNGTFAQNVGVDDVVVFHGSLTVSSGFVGPAAAPKEFDIIIPLTRPFLYDPGRGNLLIDFRNASGSSASVVDLGQSPDDGASRVFATAADATVATGADYGAEIFQIVYTAQMDVPPLVYVQPNSRSTFVGETVTFAVGASGSRPLNYQWHRDEVPILAATNATLVLTNVQLSQAGNYSVVVSNSSGVATSQAATLTVSEDSSALVVPDVSRTIDGGGASALLQGAWRNQTVYGASQFPSEIIRITELRMRPSTRFGNAFTATISNLQINLSTTIVEPNQLNVTFAQNVGADEVAVFQGSLTVSSGFIGPAAGPKEFDIIIPLMTPFMYDPGRGNLLIDFRNVSGSSAGFVDLGGRTDDGASRVFATPGDATSAIGGDYGAEVFQIVYTPQTEVPPSIYAQPDSRSTFVGETVTFAVGASGSRPLNYQWHRDAAAIPNATNATLILTNVQSSQAGNYSVVVSNAFGVVTSQTAALTVSESSVLVVPNVSRTADDGGGSTLLQAPSRHQSVYGASQFPSELIRITELRMRPSSRLGSAFTATISNLQVNLSTTSIEPNQLNGTFAQNVGTNDTVVFQGPLTVSSQFAGLANGPKEFDIIIPLTTPFLYDSSRGNLLIDFRNASGSSAGFVDMGSRIDDGASRLFAPSADATSYTGADYGAEVFQIVYTLEPVPPLIVLQPHNRSTFVGETVTLTVGALGSRPLSYQWRKDAAAIPDATNATLILTNVRPSQTGDYSVVVSNAFGVVTSQVATLTVSDSSVLVVPNVSRTVDDGGGSTLLQASSRHQTVYGASQFPSELIRIAELRLRPSSQLGSAFSATISNLQINLSTTSVEPNQLKGTFAENVGADDVVVFQGPLTVSSGFVGPANGPKEFDIIIPLMTPFLYDPSHGNLLIDFRNASGSSASFVDIGRRTNDGASRVFATSVDSTLAKEADFGAEVFQIVYTPQREVSPLIFAQPQSRFTFSGETGTLTVGAIGSSPLNYQWRKDATTIPNATNATLVLTNVQPSQAGDYSVVVSNAFGVVTSQVATLMVSESSVLVVPNASRTVDDGGGSALLQAPSRHQTVYAASQFPSEIMRITELRMRPSAQFGSAFTSTIPHLQINLSTTSVEPNQLKGTFAENVGVGEMVVFQGPLTVSSRFVGPANGPKEFDIIIPLTTAFLYDSTRGNLLIDFRNASGSGAGFVDMGSRRDDGASRLFAPSADATSYTWADFGAEVFQIVYTPQREVPPLIFAQPQSRFTFSGETVTLTVGAIGSSPLNYQWRRGTTAVPNETNATLILTNVQPSQAGDYSVVLSNAFGVVTSQVATLMVSESSVLVVPNVSRTIDDGGGSTLLQAPSRHQTVYGASQFPSELIRITELRMRPSAALGSAFTATISNLQINLSTTSVEPNGLNGTFAQNVGTNDTVVFQGSLTVSSEFMGPANGPKEFDIIIPLSTPFLYDSTRGNLLIDFRNASGSSAGLVDMGSRTDDGASRLFAPSADATSYTGADYGAEVFQIAYTLEPVPPLIVFQPHDRSTFVGETVTFTVGALGSRPLSYQWHRDAAAIPNATNATLVLTNVQPSQTGDYSVVVGNAFGVVTSQTAALTVSESSALVVPNVSRTVDDGGGSGLLNSQLRNQTLYDASLFPVEILRITELRMRPSARFGNAFTSTTPNLQINLSTTTAKPNQLNGTFTQNVGTNDTVVFEGPLTVSSGFVGPANGPKDFDIIIPLTTPFLYDPSRGNLLIDFRNASGSSASFVDMGQRTDDRASRLFASSVDATSAAGADSGAEVFQIVYTLQGGSAPSIVSEPQSRSVFAGERVSLTVQAFGTARLRYQWLKGEMGIIGATNSTLILTNVQPPDAGSYSVVVSNAYGVVASQSAALTVLETLVVPNVNGTIEGGSGSGLLKTQLRYQIVYDASLFPVESVRITELRLRPSAAVGNAFTSTIPNLQINLSTTSIEPDHLNGTFAQNVGPDELVVFQGPLTVSSRFVGPANGPKEFDILIPLSTPFMYDPGRGNLLIDFRNASGSSASFVDIGRRSDDGASRVFATSVDATSTTRADSLAEVFQIIYARQGRSAPNLQVGVTNVGGGGRTLVLTFNGLLGNCTIEASSNLTHWITLTNIVGAGGQVLVNDPAINTLPQRFYRTRMVE